MREGRWKVEEGKEKGRKGVLRKGKVNGVKGRFKCTLKGGYGEGKRVNDGK